MYLSDFIRRDIDAIVEEWAEFARSSLPPARAMTPEELSDHAKRLLEQAAVDIDQSQSATQKHRKSRGDDPNNAPGLTAAARADAQQRFSQGFSLNELLSEYRALRASVTRRWMDEMGTADRETLSELVRFNEAMDQAMSESVAWYADHVEESRNLLLAMLGHDLRTPIGAAQNSADFLLLTDGLTGTQSKAVARIRASTTRMKQMVEDLLDFTRTRLGGGLPLRRVPGNLGAVCRESVSELQAFHPDRKLDMTCSGDLSGTWDAARIAQVISNLGVNALQHGEPGTTVTIAVDGDGDAVQLKVHNMGPPVAPEAKASLFDPWMRRVVQETERREGSSGLGLGLYIVREIAKAHGGTIDVHSSAEGGTTFLVQLPRRPSRRKAEAANDQT